MTKSIELVDLIRRPRKGPATLCHPGNEDGTNVPILTEFKFPVSRSAAGCD